LLDINPLMPRHRKAFPARHRAQRQADEPDRRVPVNTAVSAAEQALESPSRPGGGPPGKTPLPAPLPAGQPGSRWHILLGLLVTPWFAAGAGVVIAAALFLNAPHAVLSFAPAPDYVTACPQQCAPAVAGPTPGSLTNAEPGVQLPPPKPAVRRAPPAAARPGAMTGVDITFRLQWQQGGAFGALMTVQADHDIAGWTLAFAIPGARISHVIGAGWQPSSSGNGGTATDPAGGQVHSYQGSQGQPSRDSARFLIIAQGSPTRPADCLFDGASCNVG